MKKHSRKATAIPSIPKRGQILDQASKATLGSRQKTYGSPVTRMIVLGDIQQLVANHCSGTPEYKAALNQVADKLSRAICSTECGEDTFTDGAAYFAIAGEVYAHGNS